MSAAIPNLATLLKRTNLDSDEELLKASNATLRKTKTDSLAQHVRVVSLLKLDRYDDAIRAFEESGDALKEKAKFEYAYALYKCGDLEKAEEVVSSGHVDERGIKHVLAQTAYRLEKFESAAALYAQLGKSSPASANEENDLRINSAAVDAQLEWKGLGHLVEKKKPTREDLEAFESAYNAACASIARGQLGQGEVLLRRAKDLCNASEELSEEDKKFERLPIITQQIYVLIQQGREDEAKRLYETIDVEDIPDLSTRQIARVNSLAMSAETLTNPFLSHRTFYLSPKLPKNDVPFEYQSHIIRQDEAVMDLLCLKYPGVAQSTADRITSQPSPTVSPAVNVSAVLNAAAYAKGQTGKAALKSILPVLEKRPNDVGLMLTVVQLYLLTGNHGSAIALIEKFFERLEELKTDGAADVRFAPGLVGVLVSLYAKQGRKAHVKAELAKAASHWRSKRKTDKKAALHASLLRAAGTSLLESSDSKDAKVAGEIFTDLYAYDSNDQANAAGLVASYATIDISRVPKDALESLTPAERLVADINAAELENAGVVRPVPSFTIKTESKKRPAVDDSKPKAKKIRPSRMPKEGFEDGKKMDPERWLPLRDRSTYRPKGRKGKAKAAGLTQGGMDEDKGKQPASTVAGGQAAKKKKSKGKKK
jgi:signal recognition particle subunit SRP72